MDIAINIGTALALTLGASAGAWSADPPYKGEGHIMVQPSELEWKDVASLPGEAKMAIIEGDPSKEAPFTLRLRLPANYQIGPHTHPEYERVTVLSGTVHMGLGETIKKDETTELNEGGVAIMAPGESMYGYTGNQETIIQLHGTGPWGIEYINPEDDPRQ